jgi:hypothetical protein
MMNKIVLAALLVPVLAGGCSTQRAWVYRSNAYAGATPNEQEVVVLPFRDDRQNVNDNRILLYLVPIVPFGWADYDVPEGATQHVTSGPWTNYKPTEDYPKALADELRSAGFDRAHFDYSDDGARYVVRGAIVDTTYSGRIYSYGLSAYGPLLWLFGLPAGSASNELEVELSLADKQTGATLVSRRYRAPRYDATSWLYVMKSDFEYPTLLAGVYKQFVAEAQPAMR